MELEQELRSASDDVMQVLEQLARLEQEKRTAMPGTAQFDSLAGEIERLAALMFSATHTEKELAERASAVDRAGTELPPIEDIPAQRDAHTILTEWREAERRLASFAIESTEHTQAAADVRRLRDEYHRYHQGQVTDKGMAR